MAYANVNAEAVGIAKSLRDMCRPDGKPASTGQRTLAFVDRWFAHLGVIVGEAPRGMWRPGQGDALTGDVAAALGVTPSEVYSAYLLLYRVTKGTVGNEVERAVRNGEDSATNAFACAARTTSRNKVKHTRAKKAAVAITNSPGVGGPAVTSEFLQTAPSVRLSMADNLLLDLATALAKAEAQAVTISSMVGKLDCEPAEGASLIKLLGEISVLLNTQGTRLFHFLNGIER